MKCINYFPFAHAPGFAGYGASRHALRCESELAGHTDYGLLVVTKDARTPKTVPWKDVAEVRLGGYILWRSVFWGLGIIAVAGFVYYLAWIVRYFSGLGAISIPLVSGIAGVHFLLAAPRRYIEARIDGQWLRWLSPPLAWNHAHDKQLVELCKDHEIPVNRT